jgi:hypothetical protein
VLEGITEIFDSSCTACRVRPDLWTEAAAIATASLAPAHSGLRRTIDAWLDRASLPDSDWLIARASDENQDSGLAAAVRNYAWKIANAAFMITPREIARLRLLGLSDPEVLDITLVTSIFSGLAIAEPLIGIEALPGPRDGQAASPRGPMSSAT